MPLRGEGGAQERPDPRGGGRILQEARAGAFQGLPASLHPSSSNTALPLASYSPLSDPYSISAFLTSGFKVHGNGAWGICRATLSSSKGCHGNSSSLLRPAACSPSPSAPSPISLRIGAGLTRWGAIAQTASFGYKPAFTNPSHACCPRDYLLSGSTCYSIA